MLLRYTRIGRQIYAIGSNPDAAIFYGLKVPQVVLGAYVLCGALTGLAGFLFPSANVIAPLVLWLWKKKESPLLDATGKEVLNFQLSCLVYGIVAAVADSIFKTDDVVLGLVALFWLVLTSVGAYQAFQGRDYRYPFIFRPVK